MRERRGTKTNQGFTLVELLVAMVVTLLVTGAVFQLMTSSQTAFRREPEVADRQQSIRVAMDRIWNDVFRAGTGTPAFAQVFTRDLDGVGAMGSAGAETDEISFIAIGDCPPLTVCGQSADSISTREELTPECYALPAVVVVGNDTQFSLGWATAPGAGVSPACPGGSARNGLAEFPAADPLNNPPVVGFGGFAATYMAIAEGVRYRVFPEADGTPGLWRTNRGPVATAADWQLVSRGIEDLQIQYLANGVWTDVPPVAAFGAVATVVERVRITLSARSTAPNLQRASDSAVGQALRGELMSEVAPRAARAVLSIGDASS